MFSAGECHTPGRLYTDNVYFAPAGSGNRTPDRRIDTLHFYHRIGPTCKLLHKDPAFIPLRTLSVFSPGMVTSVNLCGYGILAFDRQATGWSPTDGVWSL